MRLVCVALIVVELTCRADAGTITRVAPARTEIEAGRYTELNPDCSFVGYPTVRITNGPTHGRVIIRKGKYYPNYSSSNPRNVCNTRRVDATIIKYKSESGYLGWDSFSVDVIFVGGSERLDDFQITVK